MQVTDGNPPFTGCMKFFSVHTMRRDRNMNNTDRYSASVLDCNPRTIILNLQMKWLLGSNLSQF